MLLFLTAMQFRICLQCQMPAVLTDESKKVLEDCDFSSFDKEEALNSMDRQRYENQIRGKRRNFDSDSDVNGGGKFPSVCLALEIYLGLKLGRLNTPSFDLGNYYRSLNGKKTRKATLKEIRRLLDRLACEIASVGSSVTDNRKVNCDVEKVQTAKQSTRRKRDKKGKTKTKSIFYKEPGTRTSEEKYQEWEEWTEWSPCSVSCGKGRQIRWRHCIAHQCSSGDMEMREKSCQLPACGLITRFLGI